MCNSDTRTNSATVGCGLTDPRRQADDTVPDRKFRFRASLSVSWFRKLTINGGPEPHPPRTEHTHTETEEPCFHAPSKAVGPMDRGNSKGNAASFRACVVVMVGERWGTSEDWLPHPAIRTGCPLLQVTQRRGCPGSDPAQLRHGMEWS